MVIAAAGRLASWKQRQARGNPEEDGYAQNGIENCQTSDRWGLSHCKIG